MQKNDHIFRPQAAVDIDEIITWYEMQKKGLGLLFMEVLDKLVTRIIEHPLEFPKVHLQFRKATLKNFPYNVFFRLDKNRIIILAVVHQKRNPTIWKKRV